MRIMHVGRAPEMLVKFLIPVMKEQIHQGHYVCVCVSEHQDSCTSESQELSLSKISDFGIDVFTHGLSRSANPITMIRTVFQVMKLQKKLSIDTVICHSLLGSIVGRVSAWLAGIKHRIYFCHGLACAPGQARLPWIMRFGVEYFMSLFTTGMLVMNQYDYLLSRSKKFVGKDKLYMIPSMGVDMAEYSNDVFPSDKQSVHKEFGIPPEKKNVICVSRLIVQKGVDQYIDGAIEICRNRKDVCFLLVGDGPLLTQLKSSVTDADLNDQIKILGWRDDVNRLLKASDIFVLPSYYPEGRSIAILEAMAAGKAVITTNNRGCGDSVENNVTGIVIPMNDVPQLRESIVYLLENSDHRKILGKNARSYSKKNHNKAYCTQKIIESINQIVNVSPDK